MSRQGNRRFSSAHVIAVLAVLALIGVLAGGAYAASKAPKDSVTSKSVKDASLRGKDIKDNGLTGADVEEGSLGKVPSATSADGVSDGAITGAKIAADAITGAKVADGSLGGADIDEASLGIPPTEFFNVRRTAGQATTFQFLDHGGFQLGIQCGATGLPTLLFSQPGGFGLETETANSGGTFTTVRDGALTNAGWFSNPGANGESDWEYEWHADENTVVSVSASVVSVDGSVNTDCVAYGSATLQES